MGRSLRPAATHHIFYPFLLLQRRAHFTAKLFSWLLSTNKTTFVLGRRKGKEIRMELLMQNLSFPFSPCRKLPGQQQPLTASRLTVSTKQVTKLIWLFRPRQKKKRARTLLKQWEILFVGLKAEQRLTRGYNFNSFFYFTVLVSSVIS